jgi:hypothetical protein
VRPYPLLIFGLLLFAPDARAQVIINQEALNQLAGIPPPVITAPPAIRQRPHKITYRHVPPKHAGESHIAGAHVAAKAPPAPVQAAPKPAIQPVVAKPAAPPAPPKPQPPPSAVILFTAGGAGLPDNSAAMLKPFCAHSGGLVTIDAYAPADPADPSSAARLSMSRAFAIRDALAACGIASSNIIPRANGAAKTANPDAAEISENP